MSIKQDPKAAILIEETHYYDVDLGEISYASWQRAEGSIQVRIPYDGKVFKEDASAQEKYHIGNLLVSQPNGNDAEPEMFSVDLDAGEAWLDHLKSAKRAVCQAEYDVSSPEETLISIDGEVLDFSPDDDMPADITSFHNPLHLKLSLWSPDLFSPKLEEETEELERMLLQREHTQQIFMRKTANMENKLARHLTALANSSGGTIFVGVDKEGKTTGLSDRDAAEMPVILLKALFKIRPFIPFRRAQLYRMRGGRQIFVISVPLGDRGTPYAVEGRVYRREKQESLFVSKETVEPKEVQARVSDNKTLEELLGRDQEDRLLFRNNDRVAVFDGSRGLNGLRIGRTISAMINTGLKEANIIIRNPPRPPRIPFLNRDKALNMETYVKDQLGRITPDVLDASLTRTEHNDWEAVIITVPAARPFTLYDGQGFGWKEGRLEPIASGDLLEKYLHAYHATGSGAIQFENAFVYRPIRPPEQANLAPADLPENPAYHVQRQALVWAVDSFVEDEKTLGFEAILNLPLTNISLTMGDNGDVIRQSPQIGGQIAIRLDDMLVSGLEVTVERQPDEDGEARRQGDENFLRQLLGELITFIKRIVQRLGEDARQTPDHADYLQALPVVKRTYLNLNFTARLSEIFRHRRPKRSFSHFFVPNVFLDANRARDIVQACADAGFRIYDLQPEDAVPDVYVRQSEVLDDGRFYIQEGLIYGIRSNRFHDTHLSILLRCKPSPLTRELRYEDVVEVTETKAYTLEVWTMLQGKGEGVGPEIGRLQMQIYETIRQRLQKLGAE